MAAGSSLPAPCLRQDAPGGRRAAEGHVGSGRRGPESSGSEGTRRDREIERSEERRGDASAEPQRRRGRVLVVEDQVLIAMEIEDLLSDLNFEVVGAAMNAEDAMRLAILHRPDLITMDINLGAGPDGISAAIGIFQRLGIRSIFVSAYGNADTMARAEAARPLGWLQKPIRRASLEAILARLADPAGE